MNENKAGLGYQDFEEVRTQHIFYIDKTDFIREWWEYADKVTLITRPRRFGKTLNMSMTECFFSNKYAGRSDLFEGLSIWEEKSSDGEYKYRKLQGIFPVIFLSFANVKAASYEEMIFKITRVITDLYNKNEYLLERNLLNEKEREYYQGIKTGMDAKLATDAIHSMAGFMQRYYNQKVIIILDEYDTPMQDAWISGYWEETVRFFSGLFNSTFKTNEYLERGLITGITRVAKESIFTGMNNLNVITTTSNKYMTAFGFTEEEVFTALDDAGYGEQKAKVKRWYDGYVLEGNLHVYNPRAVVSSITRGKLKSYWSMTGTYEAIVPFINMDFDGLKTDIIKMLSGESVYVSTKSYKNDMVRFKNKDDILTLLIHLGYLAYDENRHKAFIPNEEIRSEFVEATDENRWNELIEIQHKSEALLKATLNMDSDAVADMVEEAHSRYTSIIEYNDENALSCVISMAYYGALKYYYLPVREMPAGR